MRNLLDQFGVTPAEEQLYRTILASSGPTTVDTLCAALDLPERTIRDGAERLVTLGFLHVPADAPDTYAALDPHLALSVVIAGYDSDLRRRLDELAELRHAALRVGREMATARPPEPSAARERDVTGNDAVAAHVAAVARSATTQLHRLDHAPPEPDSATTADDVRAIYPLALARDRDGFDRLSLLREQGESVRLVLAVPTRLIIADERRALVTVHARHEPERAMLIDDAPLVELLISGFDAMWHAAMPFVGSHPDELPDLKPDERLDLDADDVALLSLLAAGCKDRTIAHQLGIGLRTVTRRTRRLMDILGAQSRFQAGIQANRRGLV